MKVTINWLKEFVDMRGSAEEIADKLTLAGLPVAAIEKAGTGLGNIVVGKILKIDKHPQAERLTVCQVDVGKEVLKIVCGAKNMKENDLVPVATVGTTLPGGQRIEQATIRGETSFGMMCSKRELGMNEDHEGLFILDGGAKTGSLLTEFLGLDDTVLDIEVTPNRSDCLSVLGIAREISAITGVPLKSCGKESSSGKPQKVVQKKNGSGEKWDVSVQAKDHCWMYYGCLMEGITVGPSPDWLKKRLELVGLRSVNNVVDITNYVLLACGQPLHAFDADTLSGQKIVVRLAQKDESIKTIDQVSRTLDAEMMVIADGQKPVAIAGIMGGVETEIGQNTRRVFLESALFAPASVRRTAKRLGLQSDSSYRFERGVDPLGVEPALRMAIGLMEKWVGAKPVFMQKAVTQKFSARKLVVNARQISSLLGQKAGAAALGSVLKRLHFEVGKKTSDKILITIPSFRLDVRETADVAEEFARIQGYDKIPVCLPAGSVQSAAQSPQTDAIIQRALFSQGFDEVVHLSFIGAGRYDELRNIAKWQTRLVELANPLDQDQRFLRPTLLDALLGNIALNQSRGVEQCSIFEMSNVFDTHEDRPRERKCLGIAAAGSHPLIQWEGKPRAFDFLTIRCIMGLHVLD